MCRQYTACAVAAYRNTICVNVQPPRVLKYPLITVQSVVFGGRKWICGQESVIWHYDSAVRVFCVNCRKYLVIRRGFISESSAMKIQQTRDFFAVFSGRKTYADMTFSLSEIVSRFIETPAEVFINGNAIRSGRCDIYKSGLQNGIL